MSTAHGGPLRPAVRRRILHLGPRTPQERQVIATLQRFPREHPRVVDTALIALLVAISFPGSTIDVPGSATPAPWWPGVLLTCLACVALPWRRRHPSPSPW